MSDYEFDSLDHAQAQRIADDVTSLTASEVVAEVLAAAPGERHATARDVLRELAADDRDMHDRVVPLIVTELANRAAPSAPSTDGDVTLAAVEAVADVLAHPEWGRERQAARLAQYNAPGAYVHFANAVAMLALDAALRADWTDRAAEDWRMGMLSDAIEKSEQRREAGAAGEEGTHA